MQNMLLAMPILSDLATIKGSASSGNLGIGNLKTMPLKEVYRAADASSVYIEVDFSKPEQINFLSLIGHSGSSRSFARVRASNILSDLTSNPAFDSGDVPFRSHQTGYDNIWANLVIDEQYGAMERNLFFQYFATINMRYWRIDISDPNSDYLDIGRLYVAKAWQPSTNMNYGTGMGFIDPSRKARTKAGDPMSNRRPAYRYVDFSLSFADEGEMYDNAFEFDRLRGRTKDVLFIHDPDAKHTLQKRAIYGTMESLQSIVNTNYNIFEKTFRIEEIVP